VHSRISSAVAASGLAFKRARPCLLATRAAWERGKEAQYDRASSAAASAGEAEEDEEERGGEEDDEEERGGEEDDDEGELAAVASSSKTSTYHSCSPAALAIDFAADENPAERQTSKAARASSGKEVEVGEEEGFPSSPSQSLVFFFWSVTFFKNASSLSESLSAA